MKCVSSNCCIACFAFALDYDDAGRRISFRGGSKYFRKKILIKMAVFERHGSAKNGISLIWQCRTHIAILCVIGPFHIPKHVIYERISLLASNICHSTQMKASWRLIVSLRFENQSRSPAEEVGITLYPRLVFIRPPTRVFLWDSLNENT